MFRFPFLSSGLLITFLAWAAAFVSVPQANSWDTQARGRLAITSTWWNNAPTESPLHIRTCMSANAAEATETVDGSRTMQPPIGGGGDLTPPPGVSEQAEADMVPPSISTVFVAGGSGFVGTEICKQLVAAGCNVIALSRKGAPEDVGSWTKSVKWVKGNALNQDMYRSELRKSDTVISCVGGFGKTDAYMELVNGEANIKLAEAAADAGVKKFVFISVHDYKAPAFVKRIGYFEGKRRTEKVIGELFGAKAVVLKPALIYGDRKVKVPGPNGRERTVNLPLQRLGVPLLRITSTELGKRIAGSGLPLADLAWTQPLSTETVAKAAVQCCLDGADDVSVKGKESGDAVVIKVQDMVEMEA